MNSSLLRPLSRLTPVSLALGSALCFAAAAQADGNAPDTSSAVAPRATAPALQERPVTNTPKPGVTHSGVTPATMAASTAPKTAASATAKSTAKSTAPHAVPAPSTSIAASITASSREDLPRFAQNQTTPVPRTQGDANSPAAAPQERPRGLEVPVGPATTPPDGAPGVPPADPTTAPIAPPILPSGPQRPEVPPLIGNLAQAEGTEISDVRVVGNRVVPSETILAQVRSQRGAAFSARQADLDRGRVDQLGFFATVQAQVAPDVTEANKTVVTFIVVENRVVNAFKFEGNTAIKETDLLPILSSKLGVVLNRNTVNQDVTAIQKLYTDRGFAGLVSNFDLDTTGTLAYSVAEGRVSRVELSGLKKTRASLIRRQVRVKGGDPFNAALLRRDLNRIYDLGFFEDATFKVDNDENAPGSLIVTYLLKEKRTGQLSFGVGFDSRSRISGFATLQQNNLGGTGKRALATLETGSRRNYELSFGDPFIGEKNASYDVSVYQRSIFREPRIVANLTGTPDVDNNTFSYEEQRTGGRLNFTKPLDYDRNRTLLFGYRNESAKLFRTDSNGQQVPVAQSDLDSSGRVSAFSAGLLRDARDLRLDPSSGSRQQIILEQGTSFLGDTNFTKFDIDLRQYYPLLRAARTGGQPRLVLAGRIVLGKAFNQLPAFEQYYVGGSDTVRGYDADEQFGDNQVYGNLELRFRLQSKITFVTFADAGHAYGGKYTSQLVNADGTTKNTKPLFSIGVGVRLQTPIGPVRLDIGKGSDGLKTHFAIAQTF